jgi:hypothetical protein
VNSKYDGGDYAGAKSASDNAKRWIIVSCVLFVLVFLLLLA